MANNIGKRTTAPKEAHFVAPHRLDRDTVKNWVVGRLLAVKAVADKEDETIDAAFAEVLELWEIENAKKLEDWEYTAEAAASIDDYIVATDYHYVKPPEPRLYEVDSFTIAISVPAQTAGTSITYSITAKNTAVVCFEAMEQARRDLADWIVTNVSQRAPVGHPANGNQGSAQPEDEQFEFTSIRAQLYNGKMVFRLIPTQGKWVTYGIPLYGDEALKAGVSMDRYVRPGDYELVGSGVIVYKKDGKPMRAKEIELA